MILVSAFEPFGGDTVNASDAALAALVRGAAATDRPDVFRLGAPGEGGPLFRPLRLPCIYGEAAAVLGAAVDADCRGILMLGEARSRSVISVERRGRNRIGAGLADNAGRLVEGAAIDPDGPDELLASLDVEALCRDLAAAGIPAEVSDSAGGFVCNDTLYRTLAGFAPRLPVSFLHVPPTPAQAAAAGGANGMATDVVAEAAARAIRFLSAGGAPHA